MLKLYRNLLIKSITALVGLCNISEGDFAANSAYLCKHKVAKTAKLWFQYQTEYTFTNGGPSRTRTGDLAIMSRVL